MAEVSVRVLGGEDWAVFRAMRLAALQEAPGAFAASYDEEAGYDEAFWRVRLARSARLLATSVGPGVDLGPTEAGGAAGIGIVSVGQAAEPDVAELFGMWVVPSSRGAGVAWRLTQEATSHARTMGRRALQAWVATNNGRAVAFFSSYGFRPADQRRPTTIDPTVQEIAMVYPLADDRGWVLSPESRRDA
jgi:ribosomal protein S18 acetylase RimI-like enzyme